jgi:hypothetical protein
MKLYKMKERSLEVLLLLVTIVAGQTKYRITANVRQGPEELRLNNNEDKMRYEFVLEKKSWNEAFLHCLAIDGELTDLS